jgi:hypothetical protein
MGASPLRVLKSYLQVKQPFLDCFTLTRVRFGLDSQTINASVITIVRRLRGRKFRRNNGQGLGQVYCNTGFRMGPMESAQSIHPETGLERDTAGRVAERPEISKSLWRTSEDPK